MLRHLTKKNFQLTILCLLCVYSSHSQSATNSYGRVKVEITKEKKPKKNIFTKVEIESAFTGGDSSWLLSLEKTLNESIQYKNGTKAGKYIVSVQFIVNEDGNISDIKALTSNGYGMEAEVLRAIKKKAVRLPSAQGVPVRPYRTSSATPSRSI